MTSPADFVHLHVHSDYSLIDGAAKTDALAKAAKKHGQIAVALTDHGSVSGTIDFWKACDKQGVKPIVGCEAYLAPGLDDQAHTRRGIDQYGAPILNEKGKKKSFDYDHFTLIAKNLQGWINLRKLASIASLEGFYYRPRMSWALLTKYHEGLIALSGCLSGQLSNSLKIGRAEQAEADARRWKELFGDDYYVELMPVVEGPSDGHKGLAADQAKANDGCLAIARKLGIKTVATADVHYVEPAESAVQEVKICVNSYKTLEENRSSGLNMPPVFYFKSSEEMQALFRHHPEAALNTREIAEKCEKIKVLPGKFFLPKFQTPDGSPSVEYFRRLCWEGLIRRYGPAGSFDVAQRLQYEMSCIEKMGFVDYFLITQDFTSWARRNGIPVGPGRGSAAGSVVSYCLGITNIDPLRYGLIFERFLNPERVSMPDVDIDFDERGRGRVIEYVKQKYGEKCVAQIITFGESKAKSAIRDVGRVLDMAVPEVNKIAKMIPEDPKAELKDCLETIPELKAMSETSAEKKRLFELALGLEGLFRSEGKHAAGVVIADTDLMERIPLKKVGKGDEAGVCTAFSMEQVEEVGLLKMDFLGLRTITQIYDTVALVKETTGLEIDPDMIPVRDNHSMETTTGDHRCGIHGVAFSVCRCCDKTLDVFRRADTNGVFQVEGSGMRKLLKQMKPDRFDDLIALVALFRPGPLGSGMDQTYVKRKNGEEPVTYEHPSLKSITEKTYGVWCYQEQLMQLSVAIAGFTLPQADELRKATAKKKPEAMAKIKDKFIPGCVKHGGMTEEDATAIWDKIVFFSEYSFNCIAGDSEIVCADTGRVWTMADLAKSGKHIRVHAIDDHFGATKRRSVKAWKTGRREVLELRTQSGRRVTATPDHRFRRFDSWVALRDLSPGDFVAVARELSAAGETSMLHHEIIALAGLLSEGNTCHPTTIYCTNKDSPEYLNEVAECFAKFPDTVVRFEEKENGTRNVVANMGPDARGSSRHGDRSGLFLWAEKLGILGRSATQKEIPEVVFRLNTACLVKFIGRLWTGDGYIGWTKKPGRNQPFYATSSRVMAKQVQMLLARIGIMASLDEKSFKYRYRRKGARARPAGAELGDGQSGVDAKGPYVMRPGFTVRLSGRLSLEIFRDRVLGEIVGYGPQKKRFLELLDTFDDGASRDGVPVAVRELAKTARERVGLTWDELAAKSGVSMKEFMAHSSKKVMFGRRVVEAVASATDDSAVRAAASPDVFWDKVVSITPAGKADVYDMEVERDHNFAVNNGVIVHNCSHSAAYGLISWHTAWLKANYPIEFMAALLTSWSGDTDKLALYVEEIRRLGIPLEPPDVNESQARFSVKVGPEGDKTIIYGLDALKGVGSEAVRSILEARAKVGRFTSIFHFCESVDLKAVTSAVLDTLAKSGAFRSTGVSRSQILESATRLERKGRGAVKEVTENAIEIATRLAKLSKKERASGQTTLFSNDDSDADALPEAEEWTLHQALDAEREALGLYLTGHPLEEYTDVLEEFATVMSSRVAESKDVMGVIMGGVVRAIRKHVTSSGSEMAFITLEDLSGKVDAVAFPSTWEAYQDELKTGRVLFLRGDLDMRRDTPSLKIDFVCPVADAREKLNDPANVHINLWDGDARQEDMAKIKAVITAHPGSQAVFYRWFFKKTGTFSVVKQFPGGVRITGGFKDALRQALGRSGTVEYRRD